MMKKDQPDLARALGEFPEVAGLSVTLLGSGTDHVAFDAGGRFVFRVPQSEEAAARAEAERRLTSLLAPRLPLPIPVFQFVAPPSEALPFGFSGYERLPGRPAIGIELEPARQRSVARTLGGFLRVLHGIPVSEVTLPPDDAPTLEAWSAQAVEDAIAADKSASLRAYLGAPPVGRCVPSLIHGDVAAEHVLLEEDGTVSGVIDWSDAMVGDRALDLAGLVHWGGQAMLAQALETYGTCDAETLTRARWFAACRAVADIVFGLDQGRVSYVAAGERAIAHLGF